MGRTRTFDRQAVLGAAGNLFRQRGYRDVSIADLERATGLVSGSIYNAFGDKAGLFRAALDFYVSGFVRQRLDAFAGATARLEELEQLFTSVLEAPLADGSGCLVNNSIVEFGRGDSEASEAIAITLDMVRHGISDVLGRELGATATPAMTMHLLVLYQGILTLSRTGTPVGEMADMIRLEFDRLRQLRATHSKTSTRPEIHHA